MTLTSAHRNDATQLLPLLEATPSVRRRLGPTATDQSRPSLTAATTTTSTATVSVNDASCPPSPGAEPSTDLAGHLQAGSYLGVA